MILNISRLCAFLVSVSLVSGHVIPSRSENNHPTVLILGGGVAGVIAARTLKEQGISDFQIIEARSELGGRLKGTTFGKGDKIFHVEDGANWIQGTQDGNGPENPILGLVRKHGVKTQFNDFTGSVSTYDATGQVDYLDLFSRSVDEYGTLTVSAGANFSKRPLIILHNLFQAQELTRGWSTPPHAPATPWPRTPHEQAVEYFNFDWEYAQTPEQTSWIASSWANNFTFDPDQGGFSDENLLSIDQRGFKTAIQEEANQFLTSAQVLLNSVVTSISYSASGVKVTLSDNKTITGDYVLCTFSLGVLQNDDVKFEPPLPDWKQEAIQSMTMVLMQTLATYSKIFLQFPEKFWFDTELAIYADIERGRYPVWQSLDHEDFLPGSGIIFVTVTGDFSERIEVMHDDDVKAEVLGVLRSMYPNIDIPAPLDFHFPRWFSDPLYRGSYSNWPSSFFSEHHDNLRATVNERLWFAGEATSQKWFGFLHGAFFEGQDVGNEMAKCIKAGGCIGLQHVNEVKNARSYKI